MLRPPNLAVQPAAAPSGAAGEDADELYEVFKSEVAASPRRSLPAESSVFAKLASEESFTGRARFGTAVERDEAVHHLAQITRRSAADQPASPRDVGMGWNSPKNAAAASHALDHSIPPKASRMQSATLSRLAQPKRRHQSLQACVSPTRARARSPHSSAKAAQQVVVKESEEEIEVEVDSKVFLGHVESQLVFQIFPELESDDEVGTWDARQQLIIFRRSSSSPRKHQAKAESGSSIEERLLQYQAQKERRMESMRKKEQQKRLAEELAECRPSPRATSGSAPGGSGDADGVALAERCQAWAEQREAKLEAARQRQKQTEAELWGKPDPANGQGA